jgi:peptidoglycan/xylan/chitin deacetylase (PgdA/CDA1 family)
MSEDQEREIIRDAMATIQQHTGQPCAGYLAPSLTHTESTVDLFAEAGGIYTCDLFHDDQPTPLTLRSGRKFVSIPYSLELNDSIVVAVSKVEPRRWADMIKRSFDRLYREGDESGTVMCVPVHGYQVSQPHRLAAFEEAIDYITGHDDVWVTTGREIAQWYIDNQWDEAVADIASKTGRAR